MNLRKSPYVHAVVVAVLSLALAAAAPALAQGRGGGGPPGGGGPGGGMGGQGGGPGGGMGGQFPGGGPGPMSPGPRGNLPPQQGQGPGGQPGANPPHPGIQLGPPARWWDDKSIAKDLKLRPDQTAHMDAIFDQNRSTLVARLQSVRLAEAQLDQMSRVPEPDENALFTQIDRVAQARVDLEKATTRYLLQIRKEMDPDQIKRLEKLTPR